MRISQITILDNLDIWFKTAKKKKEKKKTLQQNNKEINKIA